MTKDQYSLYKLRGNKITIVHQYYLMRGGILQEQNPFQAALTVWLSHHKRDFEVLYRWVEDRLDRAIF